MDRSTNNSVNNLVLRDLEAGKDVSGGAAAWTTDPAFPPSPVVDGVLVIPGEPARLQITTDASLVGTDAFINAPFINAPVSTRWARDFKVNPGAR